MSVALVIAPKGSSRSSALREVARALAARGLAVAGFAQRVLEDEVGRKTIEVERLTTGEVRLLARTAGDPGDAPAVCSFAFDAAVFEEVGGWLEADSAPAQVLALDGPGRLELRGGGHRPALERALRAGPLVLLAVREEHLFQAVEALGLDDPVASCSTSGDAETLGRFVDAVERCARGRAGA